MAVQTVMQGDLLNCGCCGSGSGSGSGPESPVTCASQAAAVGELPLYLTLDDDPAGVSPLTMARQFGEPPIWSTGPFPAVGGGSSNQLNLYCQDGAWALVAATSFGECPDGYGSIQNPTATSSTGPLVLTFTIPLCWFTGESSGATTTGTITL